MKNIIEAVAVAMINTLKSASQKRKRTGALAARNLKRRKQTQWKTLKQKVAAAAAAKNKTEKMT